MIIIYNYNIYLSCCFVDGFYEPKNYICFSNVDNIIFYKLSIWQKKWTMNHHELSLVTRK